MKVSTIDTGFFKLDGGAMFGVVPQKLWKKLNPPDEENMCTWAMRVLLIETDDRKIIIDTGIGNKQDEKFRSHFSPHGKANLLDSLEKKGLTPEDITDVFLTHLHFDHAGGAVAKNSQGELVPTFPNATYWTNQTHWDWANNPNPRERASFLKENFVPLQTANQLKFVEEKEGVEFLSGINIHFVNGHTQAMMILLIDFQNTKLVYCADLIPSSFHISLPYVMAYDVQPLLTLKEKKWLLEKAVDEGWVLYFEHDPISECATLERNEKGRIVAERKFNLDNY